MINHFLEFYIATGPFIFTLLCVPLAIYATCRIISHNKGLSTENVDRKREHYFALAVVKIALSLVVGVCIGIVIVATGVPETALLIAFSLFLLGALSGVVTGLEDALFHWRSLG